MNNWATTNRLGKGHQGTELAQMVTPSNKALERTRRGGVPASQAIVRVSPCRSTPCSTDAVWIPIVWLYSSQSAF